MSDNDAPKLVDPLTRAGTAEQLAITLDYELTRASRYGHAIACLVVRIENLDHIEAGQGTDMRDGAVVQLSAALRNCVRGIDHLFRKDVGELVLLLPETDGTGAKVVVDRIRQQTTDETLFGARITPTPEIAVGLAVYPSPDANGAEALLAAALASSKGSR